MTASRPITLATALLAALAAAAIIALSSAPPADAHGTCVPIAFEPTKSVVNGRIRGSGDNSCTETHTFINIEVCLQKEINGTWSTIICQLNAESQSALISGAIATDCTRDSHGGKYRTRAYGFTSATTAYSQDGHMNRDWSAAKTFNCP